MLRFLTTVCANTVTTGDKGIFDIVRQAIFQTEIINIACGLVALLVAEIVKRKKKNNSRFQSK